MPVKYVKNSDIDVIIRQSAQVWVKFSDCAKENKQIEIGNIVVNLSVQTERAFSGHKASELGSVSFESRQWQRLYYLCIS
jgi:hypothetical protein